MELTKKEYEIAFLTRAEEDAAEVTKLLATHGAQIKGEGSIKKIALAYKIKGEVQAYFCVFRFDATGDAVKALEHDLRTNNAVLRALILKVEAVKETASRPRAPRPVAAASARPAAPAPLSNEALEKTIEQILS